MTHAVPYLGTAPLVSLLEHRAPVFFSSRSSILLSLSLLSLDYHPGSAPSCFSPLCNFYSSPFFQVSDVHPEPFCQVSDV